MMTERDRPEPQSRLTPDLEATLAAALKTEVLDWFGGAPEQWRTCSEAEAEVLARNVLARLCL